MAVNYGYYDENGKDLKVYAKWNAWIDPVTGKNSIAGAHYIKFKSEEEREEFISNPVEFVKNREKGEKVSDKAVKKSIEKSDITSNNIFDPGTYIGSDEVGKIEPLKQLAVVSVYVDESHFKDVKDLGVGDSKKLDSEKKAKIAEQITGWKSYDDIKEGIHFNKELGLYYSLVFYTNKQYNDRENELRSKGKNINPGNYLLSEMHNKANVKLLKFLEGKGVKITCIVIDNYMDKFKDKFEEYLKYAKDDKITDFDVTKHFEVKAESGYPVIVGTASVIGDYMDQLWQSKLNDDIGMVCDFGNDATKETMRDTYNAIKEKYPNTYRDFFKDTQTFKDLEK